MLHLSHLSILSFYLLKPTSTICLTASVLGRAAARAGSTASRPVYSLSAWLDTLTDPGLIDPYENTRGCYPYYHGRAGRYDARHLGFLLSAQPCRAFVQTRHHEREPGWQDGRPLPDRLLVD